MGVFAFFTRRRSSRECHRPGCISAEGWWHKRIQHADGGVGACMVLNCECPAYQGR